MRGVDKWGDGELAAAGGSWQEHLPVCDHPPEGGNGTRMRRMGRIFLKEPLTATAWGWAGTGAKEARKAGGTPVKQSVAGLYAQQGSILSYFSLLAQRKVTKEKAPRW